MGSGIMQSLYNVEVNEMPDFACSSCDERMVVNIGEPHAPPSKPSKLIGSAICRKCGNSTGIEIKDNMISYISGESSYGILGTNISEVAKNLYAEAEMCFRSGAPNAVAAMCRACIEASLNDKGFKGHDLNERIEKAKDALGKIEEGLAHASRLLTRNALHRGELIYLKDAPSMLSATVQILNKLANQPSVQSPQ